MEDNKQQEVLVFGIENPIIDIQVNEKDDTLLK
jgi:hypothetical protein